MIMRSVVRTGQKGGPNRSSWSGQAAPLKGQTGLQKWTTQDADHGGGRLGDDSGDRDEFEHGESEYGK